jgi:hypothetical protein
MFFAIAGRQQSRELAHLSTQGLQSILKKYSRSEAYLGTGTSRPPIKQCK